MFVASIPLMSDMNSSIQPSGEGDNDNGEMDEL